MKQNNEELHKNGLEWGVFLVSLVMILGLLGYLFYAAVTMPSTPPELLVTARRDTSESQVVRYFVTVKNNGMQTAADVLVMVKLNGMDSVKEEGQLEFPFIPRHSERSGWYQFSSDASFTDSVELQVVSYREP